MHGPVLCVLKDSEVNTAWPPPGTELAARKRNSNDQERLAARREGCRGLHGTELRKGASVLGVRQSPWNESKGRSRLRLSRTDSTLLVS